MIAGLEPADSLSPVLSKVGLSCASGRAPNFRQLLGSDCLRVYPSDRKYLNLKPCFLNHGKSIGRSNGRRASEILQALPGVLLPWASRADHDHALLFVLPVLFQSSDASGQQLPPLLRRMVNSLNDGFQALEILNDDCGTKSYLECRRRFLQFLG